MDPKPLSPAWPTMLALRPMPAIHPQTRSVFLWGDSQVHGIALRTTARALTHDVQVACIDADLAFQILPFVSMAKACRVPPDTFLRRVHLVRAFTCWQFTTLLCERLAPLLATQPIGLVVFLNPLTQFFDETVTVKEATFSFDRVLQWLASRTPQVPRLLITQTVPAHQTPRRRFARDLLRVVDVGLRLQTGERPWSVEVVKPKAPPVADRPSSGV